MSYDAVLLFSKTWGALYIGLVFLAVVVWTFLPSRREELEEAAGIPLREEERPCR